MLNISGLDNGIVLDHIPAGMSMEIYKYLNLGKLDSQVAIIKNASSKKPKMYYIHRTGTAECFPSDRSRNSHLQM